MGGAVDSVHAAVPGAAGVVGVADALDQQGQRGERAEPGQVVPGERVAEEARDGAHDRRGVIGGSLAEQGLEDRIARVVGQAVPAELGEVAGG